MNPHRQPDQSVRLSNFCLIAPRARSSEERVFVHGNFSNDAAFHTRQPSLLRTFEGDQIEAAVGTLLVSHANGQIQSGLEVVARVQLLHSNDIGPVRRTRASVNYGLYNPKGGLESEIYFLPIKLGLDVF